MLDTLIVAAEETPNPLLPAWYDIVFSIIPFVLVLLVFWRVVLPRMQAVLDERAQKIEGGIAQADKAQEEAKAALEKYNAMLAEGRSEAAAIRDQARAEGAAILAELKERASAEADRITKNAQVQIEAERQAAVVSLRSEVGALATQLAAQIVGETLADDAKARAIVDRFLTDLDASEKAAK